MKWDEQREEYELSTGKRFYANKGIVGIGSKALVVSEGYDGGVGGKDEYTRAERREMADEMIRRWNEWAK